MPTAQGGDDVPLGDGQVREALRRDRADLCRSEVAATALIGR
jgi:hypothetical protein